MAPPFSCPLLHERTLCAMVPGHVTKGSRTDGGAILPARQRTQHGRHLRLAPQRLRDVAQA